MVQVQQSTTYARLFLLVSSTDHVSGKTGVTPTVQLSKAGGAFGAAAGTVAEIGNGFYSVTYAAADTSTLGDLGVHASATGADPTDWIDEIVAYKPSTADPLATVVPGAYAVGSAGYALGTLPAGIGSVSFTYTVHSGSDSGPLIGAGVSVWVTSDVAGANYVAGPLITNDLSQVTFLLNPGTYYFWRQKAGWNFTNPDIEGVV